MTWFTLRQFRTTAWISMIGLAVMALLLGITGHNLADQWSSSGAATCHGSCESAFQAFLQLVTSSVNERVYQASLLLVYVVPPLIGIFWGAPLIARELEAGTQRLLWTQSVTRTQWIATKLAVVGTAAALTSGLLTWAVTIWSRHIDDVDDPRITPAIFGARGIVPIGYALFAFTLGVCMGMLIRRTVPAMATTLAIYIAAVVSMALWVRAHLVPAAQSTLPLDISRIHGFGISEHGVMEVVGGAEPSNVWLLTNNTITPAGNIFTGPASPQYCSNPNQGPRACLDWVGSLGLRQEISYQPASHFWALQWIEFGIFLAAAVSLAAFTIYWTRRRLT
jgi:ABC-type transport system involved in multi-copper enzyme maturation permease subunit